MFIMKKQYIVLVIIFNLQKFEIDLDTFEEWEFFFLKVL